MRVLVPVNDLFSARETESVCFGLLMARYPAIQFLWPSRGQDLRLLRQGRLPPNAAPFATDRSRELRRIASLIAADEDELPFAEAVVACASALQGMVLDAVDVPSLVPVAHLIRPAFRAVGVGVRRVVEAWMGSAAESRRHAWPEPAEQADGLEAMEARSAAAAELRYALVAPPPLPGDGPGVTLPLTALFSTELFSADDARAPDEGFGARRLAFTGVADGEGGIARCLALAAACAPPVALYCAPDCGPSWSAARRLCLQREARERGVELQVAAPPPATCGVAPALSARFDPAPLRALLRGTPVALSSRSWTAAALRAIGADELAPSRLDPLGSDAELGAVLEDLLAAADEAAAALRSGLRARDWAQDEVPPRVTLATVYGDAAPRRRAGAPVTLPPELAAAALDPARPRRDAADTPAVSVVVVADAATAPATAATLASIARQSEAEVEIVLVDDGSPDPDAMRVAADASGGFLRLMRQGPAGAAAAMNRGLDAARAPLICFLPAGSLAGPDLLDAAAAPLREAMQVAAAAPSWVDLEEGRPGHVVTPPPLTVASASAVAAAWCGPGLTVRRSAVLAAGGFDTTVGDWSVVDLLLRLLAQGDGVVPLAPPARAFRLVPTQGPARDPALLLRVLARDCPWPSWSMA